MSAETRTGQVSWLAEARRRGVLRVAASYAVIAWLLLQIADVTFEPFGIDAIWVRVLVGVAVIGFPIALALAWFFELGPAGVTSDTAPAPAARPQVLGVRRYADVLVIAVLVAVVAFLLVRQRDLEERFGVLDPAVAVLPFTNLGGDPEQEYFSDGIADELIGRLGRVPGLKVAARSSSFAFKRKQLDAKIIAQQLGVAAILEGSVRRSGGQLRLSAALIDGRSGFQLWSASYERGLESVFQVQEEIARAVSETLIPPDARQTLPVAKEPTSDVTAHDLYLLAMAGRSLILSDSISRSIDYLEKALARDPGYAQAWAALSRQITRRDFQSVVVSPTLPAAVRAEQAAYRALALDPSLSDAHGALGLVLARTGRPGAQEAFERALAINPNNTVVMHDLFVALKTGPEHAQERRRVQARILELDPLAVNNRLNYAASLRDEKRPEEFHAVMLRGLELHDDDAEALTALAMGMLNVGFPDLSYRLGRLVLAQGRDLSGRTYMANALASVDPARVSLPIDPAPTPTFPSYVARGTEAAIRIFRGDFAGADRIWRDVAPEIEGDDNPERALALILTLQGRFADAAVLHDSLRPAPHDTGPVGVELRQGLTARLYAYRKLGRDERAEALLKYISEQIRPLARTRPGAQAVWTEIAGIESVEGRRPEAVKALHEAMSVCDLPPMFVPDFPWYASLKGTPGYAALLRERERRIARIRAEFAKIDAEFAVPTR